MYREITLAYWALTDTHKHVTTVYRTASLLLTHTALSRIPTGHTAVEKMTTAKWFCCSKVYVWVKCACFFYSRNYWQHNSPIPNNTERSKHQKKSDKKSNNAKKMSYSFYTLFMFQLFGGITFIYSHSVHAVVSSCCTLSMSTHTPTHVCLPAHVTWSSFSHLPLTLTWP